MTVKEKLFQGEVISKLYETAALKKSKLPFFTQNYKPYANTIMQTEKLEKQKNLKNFQTFTTYGKKTVHI